MVARNARYAAFGSRSCWTLSLNTRLPKTSAALAGVEVTRPSFIDQSRILLMASESAADPIGQSSFLLAIWYVEDPVGPGGRVRGDNRLCTTSLAPSNVAAFQERA